MRIFLLELSSRMGSMALLEDGEPTAEKCWEENFKNRQQLFDAMASLKPVWEHIDLFAVGRGPGAFSGMRIGFSVINSLAAPAKKPVYALNSAAALVARFGADCTAVVGDARRNQVWAGVFRGTALEKEFRLLESAELHDFIPADALVVSPDHDRLAAQLDGFRILGRKDPVYPTAAELGRLVYERVKAGTASEPFEPLYMHPPVFVAPRFPA